VILYNYKKEFVGIDYEDLQQIGYNSLIDLLRDYQDFADLFIDRPGYVYNYKEFSWIDYVLNSGAQEYKAIIYTKGVGFSCDLEIKPYFLCRTPDEPGYAISLQHIRALSNEEVSYVNKIATNDASGLAQVNLVSQVPDNIYNAPSPKSTPVENIATIPTQHVNDTMSASPTPAPDIVTSHFSHDKDTLLEKLKIAAQYRFDPIIAAEELGLDVDLIEEFIEDFINQAFEFKDELISSTHKKDFGTVQSLSHKLKGVAANLRIEDSLEVLTKINSSSNQTELEVYIDYFYALVDQLQNSVGTPPSAPSSVNMPLMDISTEEIDVQEDESHYDDVAPVQTYEEPENYNAYDTIEDVPSYEMEESIEDDNNSISNNEDSDETLSISLDETPDCSDQEETQQNETLEIGLDDQMLLSVDDEIPESSPTDNEASYNTTEVVDNSENEELLGFEDIYTSDTPQNNDIVEDTILENETAEEPSIPMDNVPQEETVSIANNLPSLQFNPINAANELGLDSDLFAELISDFIVDGAEHIENIKTAIINNDSDLWNREAHILKGVSDNLRITQMAHIAQSIQETEDSQKVNELQEIFAHYLSQL
jgi:HPt (histidine-containing phosphotransfer) domain-containing protein